MVDKKPSTKSIHQEINGDDDFHMADTDEFETLSDADTDVLETLSSSDAGRVDEAEENPGFDPYNNSKEK
jgi:hypothetical protein